MSGEVGTLDLGCAEMIWFFSCPGDVVIFR